MGVGGDLLFGLSLFYLNFSSLLGTQPPIWRQQYVSLKWVWLLANRDVLLTSNRWLGAKETWMIADVKKSTFWHGKRGGWGGGERPCLALLYPCFFYFIVTKFIVLQTYRTVRICTAGWLDSLSLSFTVPFSSFSTFSLTLSKHHFSSLNAFSTTILNFAKHNYSSTNAFGTFFLIF